MSNFDRYRFQDFPWLDKDFDSMMAFLENEKERELGLYLPQKGVDARKLRALLDMASENQVMTALMLGDNNIKDEGCRELGKYLKSDKRLKYLFLEQNHITNKGLGYILDGLRENNTLKSIWLGRNDIDDDGVGMFSEHLSRTESSIKEFSVGGDKMGDAGAICLAKALSANNELTAMHLLDNNMQWTGARLIAEIASTHATCKTVEIDAKEFKYEKFSSMLNDMAASEQKKAFEEAVLNGEEGPWMRSKIMVVGQGRAGKTATVRSMLNLTFNPNLESTIGADIAMSTTKKSGDQSWEKDEDSANKRVDLALDAANRLAVLKMRKNKSERTKMLDDMSIDEVLEHLKNKREEEQKRIEQQKASAESVIPKEMQEEINQKYNATLVTNKNATLEDIAFTIWDYGGQKVFYTLHHLFLTKYGIYMLVFDMRDVIVPDVDHSTKQGIEERRRRHKQAREYIEFWLNSVYMHAAEAPLLIVGTFLDVVNDAKSIKIVNEFITKILGDKFPQVVSNNELSFFPLSNKNPYDDISALSVQTGGRRGVNIDTIRDTIESVARKLDFVNQKLSLRWIKCLDKLLELPEAHVKFSVVEEVAATCGIPDRDEVERLVKFFHELGTLVHIDSTEVLKEIVTLKPQWLITELSKVIRDKKIHRFDTAELKKTGLLKMYEMMLENNVVSKDWLEYLWPKELVDFLIDLMRRTMLISDWKFGEFADDNAFLVPSLIGDVDKEKQEWATPRLIQFFEEEEEMTVEEELQLLKENNILPGSRSALKGGFPLLNKNSKNKKNRKGLMALDIKPSKARQGQTLKNFKDFKALPNGDFQTPSGEIITAEQIRNGEVDVEGQQEGPKGFYDASKTVDSIVFDFRKSYLPSGVFQRLLCLCILKCASSNHMTVAPKLYQTSAEITMDSSAGVEQVFKITKCQKQIICQVNRDHLSAFKVLNIMMQKLKADVMGTGLEWEVFLETVDLKDVKDGKVFHSFKKMEAVKEEAIQPWFTEEQSKSQLPENNAGIALDAFLEDLDAF